MEVGGERGHVVAVVRQRDAAERGHGARDLRLGEEAEEAEHGEAAVVDLDEAAALLLLGGGVLREADGIPEVERDRVRDLVLVAGLGAVERGERARLAALGVVRAAGARLREELEEADEEDNLPLARLRDLVPEFGRRLGGVVTRDVDGQLDAVRVEACVEIKILQCIRS